MTRLIELFPSVRNGNNIYHTDFESKTPGILCALKDIGFFNKYRLCRNKIFITGMPSIGKSTAIETVKLELIKEGILFAFVNLREVSQRNINSILEKLNSEEIIVLDAYDELEEQFQGKINEILLDERKTIIISSRYRRCVEIDGKKQDIFENYEELNLLSLESHQIKLALEKKGLSVPKNEKLFSLLHNTMFISLYLKLNENCLYEDIMRIDSEYKMMELYFENLYKSKMEDRKGVKALVEGFLYYIGKLTYQLMCGNAESINVLAQNDDFKEIIFGKLVYKDEQGTVRYTHQKYADFFVAYYLNREVLSDKNIKELDFQATSLWNNALYLFGESIKNKPGVRDMFLANKVKSPYLYKNILFTYLGINDGVLDDKWDLINKDFIKFARDTRFFYDNRQIKEIRTKYFTSSKKIEAYDWYNCENIKLVLTKSKICKGDFANMFCLKQLILNNGVKVVDSFAFLNCDRLNKLEISETLRKVKPHAFYMCSSLHVITASDNKEQTKFFIIEDNNLIEKKKKSIVLLCQSFKRKESYANSLHYGAIDNYRLSDWEIGFKINLPTNILNFPTKKMFSYSILYGIEEKQEEQFTINYFKIARLNLLKIIGIGWGIKWKQSCYGECIDIVSQGNKIYIQNNWQASRFIDGTYRLPCSPAQLKYRQDCPNEITSIYKIDKDHSLDYKKETKKRAKFWLWLHDVTDSVMTIGNQKEYKKIYDSIYYQDIKDKKAIIGYMNNNQFIWMILYFAISILSMGIFGCLWAFTPLVVQGWNLINAVTNGFVATISIYFIYCLIFSVPGFFIAKTIGNKLYKNCILQVMEYQQWLLNDKGINTYCIFKI